MLLWVKAGATKMHEMPLLSTACADEEGKCSRFGFFASIFSRRDVVLTAPFSPSGKNKSSRKVMSEYLYWVTELGYTKSAVGSAATT